MKILELNSIVVFYGKMQILHTVSLGLDKGGITGIIGHNGGGKSTILQAISGLVKVKAGVIMLKGKKISNFPPEKIVEEGISLVEAKRRLFPYLSVHDNLRIGAYFKRAWQEQKRNLKLIYDLFPRLLSLRNQEARTLSGGEQQMLLIGRALMSQPEILMLDEPSSGLAPILVSKVFDVLGDIRKRGITIFVAEQSAAKILRMADNAYVLENGEIVMEGNGQELFNNPVVVESYLRV